MNIDHGRPILFLALLTHCRSAKLAENKISGIDIKIGGNVLKVTTSLLNDKVTHYQLEIIDIFPNEHLV